MTRRFTFITAGLVASLAAVPAFAETAPKSGSHDARVTYATYQEGQVYRITTRLRTVTLVELGDGEKIQSIAIGDLESFKIDKLERSNLFIIKTKALVEGDAEAEAARAREEELARRRQEAEMLRQAQINSDMVALRGADGGSLPASEDAAGLSGERFTGDEAFRRAGAEAPEARQASIIANPAYTLVQGTLIEAALETAVSTDLSGNVAAIISHDVWSFDMSRVLIPRGSRLFGRYDSDVDAGQRRVLIAWDRIVTTDGQSVELAAYGTDRIGRSGLPGKVRNHFLQRFGTAALISVIGAVPAIAAEKYDSNQTASDTDENVGNDLGEAVNDVMADYLRIPPTISVNQGAVVMVRVDADIEFY